MTTPFTKHSILTASSDQISADIAPNHSGNMIILGLSNGVYYELNEVGTRVWNLIQQPCRVQTILDTLLDEYEVDVRQCEVDLFALLEDLAKHGLIDAK